MTPDNASIEVLSKLVEEALWKLQTDNERVVLKALIQTALEHICAIVAKSELALAVPDKEETPCP